MEINKKVVVTTERRGIFFGTLLEGSLEEKYVRIKDARVCVYWPASVKGFVGLAAVGPLDGSRVSPAAPEITLLGITSVLKCTDAASEQWERGSWS